LKKKDLRIFKLLEMLRMHHRLNIATVVEKLQISEATARRLFSELESQNKLIRTHGGVQLAPELESGYSFKVSAAMYTTEKKIIGIAAAKEVRSGDKIFLDSGTTVLKMSDALAERIRRHEIKDITVVTNSISYINNLAEVCNVLLVGGFMRPERLDICGPLAENNLQKYHFNKSFFGADAISLTGELMTTDELTGKINRIAIEHSQKNFLLATSDKFGKTSFVSYQKLNSNFTIFTDFKINKTFCKKLKKIFTGPIIINE